MLVLLKFFAFYCGMLYAPLSHAYMNLFLNQHDVMRLLGKFFLIFLYVILL